jgi:hypothetical protein
LAGFEVAMGGRFSSGRRGASDPFFEELRAEIQEGIDQADHGELIDESDVWQCVYAVNDEIEPLRAQGL